MAIKFGRPLERKTRIVPVEAPPALPLDLAHRPRRLRQTDWLRRMVRENELSAADLIWPIFVVDGRTARTPIPSMPGVERLSIDEAMREVERAAKLTIPCVAIFPYTDPALRNEEGSEATNPDNLVCRAVRAIKRLRCDRIQRCAGHRQLGRGAG